MLCQLVAIDHSQVDRWSGQQFAVLAGHVGAHQWSSADRLGAALRLLEGLF